LLFPNDARGQALHVLLDTQCATPSYPSPYRGYRTVSSDGVLPLSRKPVAPRRLNQSSSGGPVERWFYSLALTLKPFSANRAEATPRGPQHLPSAPASAFWFNPSFGRKRGLRSLSLHGGSRLAPGRPGWGPTLSSRCRDLSNCGAMPPHASPVRPESSGLAQGSETRRPGKGFLVPASFWDLAF